MFGKKLYFFFFNILLLAGYLAAYFLASPLDAYRIISILFITLAFAQLYFVPVFLPKNEKGYGSVRLGLLFSSLIYLVITVVVGYLFSFQYVLEGNIPNTNVELNESFYFLVQAIFFVIYSSTIILTVSKPDKYDEYDDDIEEPVTIPEKPKNQIEETSKKEETTDETTSNETKE